MTTYYHGGPAGLNRILPSSFTGVKSLADYGGEGVTRRDKVYVVTSYTAAAIYAAMDPRGSGTVYEVEPIGPLDPDPDFRGDGSDGVRSYQCDEASIIRRRRLSASEVATVWAALAERAEVVR